MSCLCVRISSGHILQLARLIPLTSTGDGGWGAFYSPVTDAISYGSILAIHNAYRKEKTQRDCWVVRQRFPSKPPAIYTIGGALSDVSEYCLLIHSPFHIHSDRGRDAGALLSRQCLETRHVMFRRARQMSMKQEDVTCDRFPMIKMPICTIVLQGIHFRHTMNQTLVDGKERDMWIIENEDDRVSQTTTWMNC